jgi:ParB family transcriptional regulator, chromosome partitioning protein
MSDSGHIELERQVDSIRIGVRHRTELGDLRPLMDSIQRLGLLQPVTIAPDGVLICGRRRLEAVKRLGWNTLRVWVRTGLSDDLSQLLAQQDENATHKPLAPLEAAALFREMKVLLQEDANRRQKATQFGADIDTTAGQTRDGESPSPQRKGLGEVRRRAATLVTQKDSHQQLERISEIERVAADVSRPAHLRQIAEDELEAIRNGGGVDPSFQRLKAAMKLALLSTPPESEDDIVAQAAETLARARQDRARRVKENRAKRAAAAASAKRSVRSFALMWAELDGWSKHYDTGAIARELKADDWALFLRVLDETKAFAESVALARE